jgi:hypothetical protein
MRSNTESSGPLILCAYLDLLKNLSQTRSTDMSVNAQYTAEMRKRFGYSATWVPTTEVRLGDVGILRNYEYERVRTLKDFGIGFKIRTDPAMGILEYTSADSVSLDVKAASDIPTGAKIADLGARVEVSFSKGNAVFFQASDCITTSIEDQHALGHSLLKLYEAGDWPEDYVVITEVIRAKRTTVLVSSGHNALIELAIKGDIKPGYYTLVDANAGISVSRVHNIGTQVVAERELTPLFKAKGIKKRLLRSPIFDRRGGSNRSSQQDGISDEERRPVFVGDVDYDNYA